MTDSNHVLVLGSGFTSHEVNQILSDSQIRATFVDPSIALKSRTIRSDSLAFNPEMSELTRKRGGGATVWGGKVTLPTENNWLANVEDNVEWNDFTTWCRQWLGRSPATEFTSQSLRFRDWAYYAPSSHSWKGTQERNIFLLDPEKMNNSVIEFSKKTHTAIRIKSWAFDASEQVHRLEWLDQSLNPQTTIADAVILASGTIGNAKLVSLLTGQTSFPLGNHLEFNIGKLRFDHYRRLGQMAYLHHGRDFLSFAKTEFNGLQHSIRFVPSDSTTKSLAEVEFGRKGFLARFLNLVFLKFGWVNEVGVDLWLDTGQIGTISFTLDSENNFLEESYHASEERIREILVKASVRAEFPRELELGGLFIGREEEKLQPSDTAHYFGTTPMEVESNKSVQDRATVDRNFLLRAGDIQNAYCLGSSSFALGSHGHPTLMAVLTAHRAAEKLINEL